ncbi:molybdate ABC transporter substrate-binding protein [Nocardiopsis composta]|uniref:Molybdate transport system substrate-binding protein n=1 Tax=Nocardiopsis composta TaxID=157465 RepID=A0A7W8QPT4_9ACTN|nr:molybdate ABC transporter substrate-binding protein [Nocardiopsis composta]MBB5434360.1 molybdate transport system substrate-binding protein [Nocardiopsis composta]
MTDRYLRAGTAAASALLLAGLAGCGGGSGGGDGGEDPGAEGGGSLTVFAAASLTEVFTDLGERFEEETGSTVEFSFAGSSDLAQQIADGAPADVFASADVPNMDKVTEGGFAEGDPEVFARNVLQIAVPPDNPAGVEGFDDLAGDGVTVAVCAPEVPCGAAAEELMDATGVEIDAASQEEDVKAALTKARLGEVDAALVYETDVRAAGDDVRGIGIDGAEDAANDYPIVPLTSSGDPELAREWVDFVLSEEGAGALADAGFRPASGA